MPTYDHVASTYCVCQSKVLLIWHKKLGAWFPPGGHVELGEMPSAAALREFLEETGIPANLFISRMPPAWVSDVEPSIAPIHQQMEFINDNHRHLDHIYIASPATLDLNPLETQKYSLKWFSRQTLLTEDIPHSVKDTGINILSRFNFLPIQFMQEGVQRQLPELPHVSIVIGPPGSGKSTTVKTLIARALKKNASVGVINCDIGRPTVGPPSCVWCGIATQVGIQIHGATFVGGLATSGFTSQIKSSAAHYRRFLSSLDVDHIIIDTPGYVFGSEAEHFVDSLISITRSDLVITQKDPLGREDYRTHLKALSICPEYQVTPLTVLPQTTLTERRKCHQQLINNHFGRTEHIKVSVSSIRFWSHTGQVEISTVANKYIGYFAAFDESPIPIICQITHVNQREGYLVLRIPEGSGPIAGNLALGEFHVDPSGVIQHRPEFIDEQIVALHFP